MGTWDHDIPPGYPFRPNWASDGTYQAVPPVGLRNPMGTGVAAFVTSEAGSAVLALALGGGLAWWLSRSNKGRELEGEDPGAVYIDYDPGLSGVDYDYPMPVEGKMAKSYLWQVERDARALREGLNDDDNLPGWVNSYIATSADRVGTASNYMQYKFQSSQYSGYGDYGLMGFGGGATAQDIVDFYGKFGVDYAKASKIVSVANALGIPDPAMLANVIRMESQFNPQIQNPVYLENCGGGNATGLIQFTPCTARELGTSTRDIKRMGFMDQMEYVKRYFQLDRVAGGKKLNTQLDVMMAVFYPDAIGSPNYRFSADISAKNHGIVTPTDYLALAQDQGLMPVNESLINKAWEYVPTLNPLTIMQKWWYGYGLLGKVAIVGGVALATTAVVTMASGGAVGYGAYRAVKRVVGRANPTGQRIAYKGDKFEFETGWDMSGLGGVMLIGGGIALSFYTAGLAVPVGVPMALSGITLLGGNPWLTPGQFVNVVARGWNAVFGHGDGPKQIAQSNPFGADPVWEPVREGRADKDEDEDENEDEYWDIPHLNRLRPKTDWEWAVLRGESIAAKTNPFGNPHMLPPSGRHARGFAYAIGNPKYPDISRLMGEVSPERLKELFEEMQTRQAMTVEERIAELRARAERLDRGRKQQKKSRRSRRRSWSKRR